MRNICSGLLLVTLLVLSSCSADQSLQEYYIDNTENPNFLTFDIPTSILNIDVTELSEQQRVAYESLRKLNVLAFKVTPENTTDFGTEKDKVRSILASDNYEELMKINTPYGRATVQFKGDDDAIDEVIIFGDHTDKGFAIVRVLGRNMNPAHFAQFLQILEKSDFDAVQFEELGELVK